MIVRHCAGGVVFQANKVFLVRNDKGEWTLPKGKINDGEFKYESASMRVKEETGLDVNVLEAAGDTMYEFYSQTREQQVCNAVTWYIMDTKDQEYIISEEFIEGGFYRVKDAIGLLSHSKEISLVEISFKKYKELKKNYCEGNLSQSSN